MSKGRKLRPDAAIELQEEIEGYLRWKGIEESMTDTKHLPFEERLVNALRHRCADFFEELAAFCRVGTNQWHISQMGEPDVVWIAVQSRVWLESKQMPVTRPAIRKLTKEIWSAHLAGHKPNTNLVFASSSEITPELWVLQPGSGYEKQPAPIAVETHRPPGAWSEIDYIDALQIALARPENGNIRADIEKAALSFPKTAWPRAWKDPRLCDVPKD